MDAYQAGQQLGTLLFGGQGGSGSSDGSPSLFDALSGRVPQGNVYNKTLLTGAQAQSAMQEARMNRAKALIEEQRAAERAKLPAAVSGVYTNPAAASLVESILGGNETSDLRDLGALQSPNALAALGQAAADMNAGNFPGYNQQTALAAGKPYEPVRVVDNTMLPSGVPLGDAAFTAQATPVGQADIAAHNAAAQDSLANAARARAGIGADKAGNYDILPTESGFVRVNKLTGNASPVTLGDAALMPHEKGYTPTMSAQDRGRMQDAFTLINSGRATAQQVAQRFIAAGRPDLAKLVVTPAYTSDDGQ